MKRLLILGALALGCDNPAVSAKALDVLEHGIVAGQADCSCTLHNVANTPATGLFYKAQRLLDGSCFTHQESVSMKFCSRDDACAVDCSSGPFSLADGVFTVALNENPLNIYFAPIETCCTGFNFEAFGVE